MEVATELCVSEYESGAPNVSLSPTFCKNSIPSPQSASTIAGSCVNDASETVNELVSSRWDLNVQTPHGGQEWRELPTYIEDFSVTTNALGAPKDALLAAKTGLSEIEHYPPSDFEPALTSLSSFLGRTQEEARLLKEKLVLGNGASELIELSVRLCKATTWRTGPFAAQYMEYERSAKNQGMQKKSWDDDSADLLCIVNPCNPTGDFFNLEKMKAYITEHCKNSATVIIDESMQAWYGPGWREQSLVSAHEWIQSMAAERGVKIFVLHSWTKLWSCPGLRIGSLIGPTDEDAKAVRRVQVPWALNTCAIAFLDAAVKDEEYLRATWSKTPVWRQEICDAIKELHPNWSLFGEKFLSFIWIDTQSEREASFYVRTCRERGVPIRAGAAGYNMPTFIRIGVRKPESVQALVDALSTHFEVE